jgi:Mg-chelatase subunit ChlD
MKPFLGAIEFAQPQFFWLLCLLPLLWLRYRDRRLALLFARTLIAALMILILADPQTVTEQNRNEERIFAYDLSQSITSGMQKWMAKTTQELAPGPQDRVFIFGAEAKATADLPEAGLADGAGPSKIDGRQTNLENLLAKILELPAAPRSLFLFTDGWETQGDIERLLPAAAAAGVKIYPMVPAERQTVANVAVTKLLAPTQGNSGENLNLKVVLENHNDHAVEGSLVLKRNGQVFKTESVKLPPGSQSFTYQTAPDQSALTVFHASFSARNAPDDRFSADNHGLAWVTVRTRAKILLINGHSGAGRHMEEIIKRQGFDLTVRTPENAPAPSGFKLIIFNNAERDKFPSGYFNAVERQVTEGGGFIMLGADNSFAPASYRQTPIEKLLPLEPKEPPKKEEKNRAVVLVVDKSGSMRDDNRIVYAKEAAKAVARQLRDIDLLGVVGFDDNPFVVVYLETMARLRGVVDNQIDRLKPGGQTYFLPALKEARQQLERVSASRKHVILLSDGVTRGSQGELVDLVAHMKNELKITVSAVAISAEADVRIMKRISQYGGGLFHHTIDPSSLPQIVLEQLQDKSKEEPQNDGPLIPQLDRTSELLAGLPNRAYPPLLGYIETDVKRGAQLDLFIPRPDRRAPLLASWRYGRGKAIALATDLEGRWSRNWIPWSGLPGFWAKLFDWLIPAEENLVPAHEARVSMVGDQAVLDLTIFDEGSANSQYRYSAGGKADKHSGNLIKMVPGHYQATLPITKTGEYRIDLTEERAGRSIAFPPVGYSFTTAPKSEFVRPDFNLRLLSRLAQATGGEVSPKSLEKLMKSSSSKTMSGLRQELIIAVFALFLVEIAVRKFALGEPD